MISNYYCLPTKSSERPKIIKFSVWRLIEWRNTCVKWITMIKIPTLFPTNSPFYRTIFLRGSWLIIIITYQFYYKYVSWASTTRIRSSYIIIIKYYLNYTCNETKLIQSVFYNFNDSLSFSSNNYTAMIGNFNYVLNIAGFHN